MQLAYIMAVFLLVFVIYGERNLQKGLTVSKAKIVCRYSKFATEESDLKDGIVYCKDREGNFIAVLPKGNK